MRWLLINLMRQALEWVDRPDPIPEKDTEDVVKIDIRPRGHADAGGDDETRGDRRVIP